MANETIVHHVTTNAYPDDPPQDHGLYAREEAAIEIAKAEVDRERAGWEAVIEDRVEVERVRVPGVTIFRFQSEGGPLPCEVHVRRRVVKP